MRRNRRTLARGKAVESFVVGHPRRDVGANKPPTGDAGHLRLGVYYAYQVTVNAPAGAVAIAASRYSLDCYTRVEGLLA